MLKPVALASLLTVFVTSHGTAVGKDLIPQGMNERVEMLSVGAGWSKTELETTLFVPPGPGPFPLVIINHGKAFGNPRFDPRARYKVASREFLKRGYLVAIPMRRGYSKSGGTLIDAGCNTESNGRMQGEEIQEALARLLERPDVDKSRVLLVGQSYGGIAAVAAGTANPPSVKGILNFAGGIRRSESCAWQNALVDAFAAYGKESRIPGLWFYGDNDSYWGAELPHRMHQAFELAGGNARLIAYGVFTGGDAHGMFSSAKGLSIWWPETEKFLDRIGMPTEIRFDVDVTPRPPRTEFAATEDIRAVPYLDERRREAYRKFLQMPYPRAFAIASTGNVGWAYEGVDPLDTALANCEKVATIPCSLYVVDDDVVWRNQKEFK